MTTSCFQLIKSWMVPAMQITGEARAWVGRHEAQLLKIFPDL